MAVRHSGSCWSAAGASPWIKGAGSKIREGGTGASPSEQFTLYYSNGLLVTDRVAPGQNVLLRSCHDWDVWWRSAMPEHQDWDVRTCAARRCGCSLLMARLSTWPGA